MGRLRHARTLFLVAANLAALAAGWTGCSGSATHVSSGAGGSAMGGAASSAASSVASTAAAGTGGSAGGGAGGTGGVSGNGGACASASTKVCGGTCVAVDDPAYGCTPTGCEPCSMQYPNASQACENGACALGDCDTGLENCDGDDANGCEANIANDPNNCGACGAVCTVPHAQAECTNGMCGVGSCDQGWKDCNADPTDGCETDFQNDPMNCGECGSVCPCPGSPSQSCLMGTCGCSCPLLTANCLGDPPSVCATMLGDDQNCAFCDDACGNGAYCLVVGSSASCAPCAAGSADCDGDASNACEIDTQNDPANCGGCGISCGGQACVSGVCAAGGADGGGGDGG